MMPELALKEAASKSLDIFMAQLERDMPSDAHYVPSPALDASIQKLCRKAAHPYSRRYAPGHKSPGTGRLLGVGQRNIPEHHFLSI